jgi:drug/metabolite transporter (DMT)-like permease
MQFSLLGGIFAVLSPCIFAVMNMTDKYVVANKVKSPLGFAPVAGLVNLIIGILLALFLPWNVSMLKELWIPALAGALMGSQFFMYYKVLKDEDASYVIGFIYLYPVLVALLSFAFLSEALSIVGYGGMLLVLIGVLGISVRLNKRLTIKIWLLLLVMVVVVALNEFFIKIATSSLPEWNGTAINLIFMGLTVLLILANKSYRGDFFKEFHNFPWAIASEVLTFLAVLTLYFAMARLPAAFVSAVAAIQPLAVLVFERLLQYKGMIKGEYELLPKLIPISLIVLGVTLLYLSVAV